MTTAAVVGPLLIVIGAALIIGVGVLYLVARGSTRWSQTEGRIVSASLLGKGGTTTETGTVTQRNYRVIVQYAYEVDGRALTGDRIQFGDSLFGWNIASSLSPYQLSYKAGQVVAVYYDPAHPERCTLSRVVPDWWFRQLLVAALIFVVVGVGVLTGHVAVVG